MRRFQCKPVYLRVWKPRARIFQIPKGLRPKAQGCELASYPGDPSTKSLTTTWLRPKPFCNPSIPNIFFIPFNFVPAQQGAQFILETDFAMMFLLPDNILFHLVKV